MLLKSYRKEIFRPEMNPGFQSLHCIAHLDQDIGEALPYLNTLLGGFEYIKDPPSLTLKAHGKLMTLHCRKIAVNALKDEQEAGKILDWLQREINEAWDKRSEIQPSYEGAPKPDILEILKLLPQTNCRECGQPTCMVFATLLAQGAKGPEDCIPLEKANRQSLEQLLSPLS